MKIYQQKKLLFVNNKNVLALQQKFALFKDFCKIEEINKNKDTKIKFVAVLSISYVNDIENSFICNYSDISISFYALCTQMLVKLTW